MKAVPILVFAALIAGGVLSSLGTEDKTVSLASAREVWSDILRDADQIGLHATRMPLSEEIDLGKRLSAEFQGWAAEDRRDTRYVTRVAAELAPYVRRTRMPWTFHVVGSPSINAFALPGGQIYVLRGMMDFLQNEAELAAILGHEMAHVDLMHCVEQYQYQHALRKAGAGDTGAFIDFARRLVAIGYNQFQELEADAEGARIATQAGYDPAAAEAVFSRMEAQFGASGYRQASRPVEEVGGAMEDALRDYFRTHPRTSERARKMHAFASKRSQFRGRSFYVGTQNYAQRLPRSAANAAGEWKTY